MEDFKDFCFNTYGYELDNNDHILFPDDRRAHELSADVKHIFHPAKNNLFMLEALCHYLTMDKWIPAVLDPMAGAGSILAGAKHCDSMVLIELGEYFSQQIAINISKMDLSRKGYFMPKTDCVEWMKQIVDDSITATIFSPPYADQLQKRKGTKVYDDENNTAGKGIKNYAFEHKRNISNMAQFQFNQIMKAFYKEVYRVTQPMGFVCCIIKDRMKDGKRVGYGVEQARWAYQAGFSPYQWHQRYAVGSIFGTWNRKQGIAQVEDEHIIIMQKRVKQNGQQ